MLSAQQLPSVEQSREVLGNLAEDPGLATLLGLLDRVPVAQDGARRLGLDVAEDVRVPAHELGVHVIGHLGQRPVPALLQQQ